MPHEGRSPTTGEATERLTMAQRVARLAQEIATLEPGPAAALRRGPQNGAGAAAFWKLLARYGPDHELDRDREEGWGALIQAIAILTPKGRSRDSAPKEPAHDPLKAMGAALHDARVSELRLARLLTASQRLRRVLVVRLCRRLAAADQRRFDLRTLAQFILYGQDAGRRIARDYYRAQTVAGRQTELRET